MDNLQDLPNEIWKRIPGYSLYEISNMGRIKTFNQFGCGRTAIMKPALDPNGYWRTMLKRDSDGKVHTIKVHRLVAITFIPNPENKPQVNHINSKPADNRLSNLEWVTRSENMIHAHKFGNKSCKGEKNPATNLTDEIVLEIRSKYTYGRNGKPKPGDVTRQMLSDEYGVGMH
ncbi:MAG: NUMOD4 domain-containing protein, partial [Algoriella sp.]|uniref:NUMOD4 domain-containing protein n=1 Tax=Algoriella sp. TaxID=1872434 RepID=UPI002FC6D64F